MAMECERNVCEAMRKLQILTDFGDKEKDWKKIGEKKVSKNEGLRAEKIIQSIGNNENTKKVLKNQKGWNHTWNFTWATPNKLNLEDGLSVRDVVPGPFISPKLVKVTPFVLNSTSQLKNEDRIRRGIPDAWAEYLALNGLSSDIDKKNIEKELTLGYSNLQVTDFVWNELGLPLTQGIPDPWKPVLSENYSRYGDERVDICLCNPAISKIPKCHIRCERKAKKVKCKSFKREFLKPENELYKIPEQISKEKKNKYQGKVNGRLHPNFLRRSEFNNNRESESLQELNNVIQCDISGKITFQGKSFEGVGSLKFKCGQNGNFISQGIQQTESRQYLPNFAQNIYNKLSQNSKIRDMVSNLAPKKQFSKFKNIFNGKKDDESEDFGEEIKLICCKCSCPYFRVLPNELLNDDLMKEKITKNLPASYKGSKNQIEIETRKKTHKTRCDCKKNKKRKDYLEKKIEKDNSFKKDNEDDKKGRDYEIQHTEDSIDSGDNADVSVSDYSKPDEKSLRESVTQSLTSLNEIANPNGKSKEKLHEEFKTEEKGTSKEQNVCIPCGKRLTRKTSKDNNVTKDLTSDLTDDLPSRKDGRKYPRRRKLESERVQSPNTQPRQRAVSYSSDVERMAKDKEKMEKKAPYLEKSRPSRISSGAMIPRLEEKKTSDKEGISEKNSQNDNNGIEILSKNSDEELSIEDTKLSDSSQVESRNRGGGMEIRFPRKDTEFDNRETRKKAWCDEENRVDCFRKISEEDVSDIELESVISSKIWSSLLEESLDLISEPIGRKKAEDNKKTPEEEISMKENKCYVNYCSDQLKKCRES